ncbi:MAG: phosphate transporter permease subunit PstC [Jatrophihabitans sp.]|nr:phosphate transporter permease subunit PstC [Jatrophihabitans sp.]
MPDEPVDELSVELRAGGVAETAPGHLVGSAQPLGVDVSGPGPVSTAPAPSGSTPKRPGDRIFSALASGSGLFIVVLVVLVGAFLLWKAIPAIGDDKTNFLTSRIWSVGDRANSFGIAGLLWTTVLISVFAMVVAVPIAVGIALFVTHYAPARLAKPVAAVIDLLAAIPSIIYGIWGIAILAPHLTGVQNGLSSGLGWIPLFKHHNNAVGTVFDGGVVLAIMILPIITSISREVFQRTPRQNIEAALALGSTRWEMIQLAVLPYGRPGVVSGAMLGLGRALGETIAITIIVSTAGNGAPFDASLFGKGNTFASQIATGGDALFAHPGPFIAAGLVLFVLTFLVNAAARAVVNRKTVS